MPTVEVELPTLHVDQVKAYRLPGRFKAVRCGRRWGKTDFAKTIACDSAAHGESVGWFAPDYKISSEAFNEIVDILEPIKSRSSKVEGVIRTRSRGRIDFWTLDNERAGRSRKYHRVIIDEAAFTNANMLSIWEQSILPTLLDYSGEAWVLSNTNGIDPENFFYQICPRPGEAVSKLGFVEHHAPSFNNPFVPAHKPGETEEDYLVRRAAVYEKLEADNHPLVYQQEYLAEFVDWSGTAFFEREKLLVNGVAPPLPDICDYVFAVIDTAIKTGKANDGTGVTYFARSRHFGHPLVVLDWDLQQIEGASLEEWLPSVYRRLEELAARCRARVGSLGAFIEDKGSGTILLQQAVKRGWRALPIANELTDMGKDGRAISVSGYAYRGEVKMSQPAYDKVTTYKGTSRNHLLGQVLGFRIGDKDAAKREDDLLDTFCYGIAISLGDKKGN